MLILLVRSLAGAFRRAAGTHPRAFPGRNRPSRPLSRSASSVWSRPRGPGSCGAAALWAAFGAAAYGGRSRPGSPGAAEPGGLRGRPGDTLRNRRPDRDPAGLAGAVLAAALLSYAARRRMPL
ncbi:MAG: hypothetical protein M0C28_43610 [Candidatus Moduliflexus flocculans]|nr:hypothetical protein [Candidatus Moduliflexus flocculans]